ncbi:unnamed protein product [Cuscuta europaea]|uniref:DUF7769 domain-containing protein n=1 Tax=Cuscuta europaea TaxID=41803 RepID=A0A9P1EPX6_CUSEU|nr:unnamed protein product [Cuscuta europaea]
MEVQLSAFTGGTKSSSTFLSPAIQHTQVVRREGKGRKHVELSDIDRNRAVEILLAKSVNGALKGGLIAAVATEFNVSRRAMATLWKKVQRQLKAE